MATTLTPTTAITSTSIVDTESVGEEKRDITTLLNYWKRLENRSISVDFSTPGAQERLDQLSNLNEAHTVLIHDVRGDESKYTLERNGFQYVHHHVKELEDCSNEEQVREVLLPATEELVKQITGATKIVTFAHRIRCLATDERQLAASQAPAHDVHSDFTSSGAMEHLKDIIQDQAEFNRLLDGRILVINVWRPLKQIRKDPLAVCDWRSVDSETDLVANRMIFSHGWKELAKANFNPKHMWYYLGGQMPNEPLLFKQFDSKAKDGMNLPHTAFVDLKYIECNPRESIEIKMYAFLSS
ncbi:hypothetical protein VE04_10314 [Pseudogymnoascus sp. 24MN13]|nr:hypothetical protein VE04_10314 [Pseudogymnoascus sp. 24MN13]